MSIGLAFHHTAVVGYLSNANERQMACILYNLNRRQWRRLQHLQDPNFQVRTWSGDRRPYEIHETYHVRAEDSI